MKKLIVGIIIGLVLAFTINIVGASMESSGVMYKSKTLNTVLDDLYSKINEINNIGDADKSDILSGKTVLVKGTKVTGTMKNWTGIPQHIDAVWVDNDTKKFKIAVAEGYHNYYFEGNSYEYLTFSEVAEKIGLTSDKIVNSDTILGITGTHSSINHNYKIINSWVHNHTDAESTSSFNYTATQQGKIIIFFGFSSDTGKISELMNYSVIKNDSIVKEVDSFINSDEDGKTWNAGINYIIDVELGDTIKANISLPASAGVNSVSSFALYVQ